MHCMIQQMIFPLPIRIVQTKDVQQCLATLPLWTGGSCSRKSNA